MTRPDSPAEREAIHAWIRNDLGVAAKMTIYPEHVRMLLDRLGDCSSRLPSEEEVARAAYDARLAELPPRSAPAWEDLSNEARDLLREIVGAVLALFTPAREDER